MSNTKITPDLKFETLLQESDLQPNQQEKFMNAMTEVLKTKNLDYSDIRLKDLVNVFYRDLYHVGLPIQNVGKFIDFLEQNGFKVNTDHGKNNGRLEMRDHPEIKGSDLKVYDLQKEAVAAARTEQIKNVTLDTPLDQFLDIADILVWRRKMYYDRLTEALNDVKEFPGGSIKDLSEVKVRDLEGVPFKHVFYEQTGWSRTNYRAVKNLFHETGISFGPVNNVKETVSDGIRVVGVIPESKKQASELSEEKDRLTQDAKLAIHDRIINTWQRSFTADQIEVLNRYHQVVAPDDPANETFSRLLDEVAQDPDVARKPEKWVTDTAKELDDLAEGITRDQDRGLHM